MFQKNALFNSTETRSAMMQRFASVVRARPESIAVSAAECTLTYAKLDSASKDLAQRLNEMGVKRGSLVAVMTDRTVDVAVAYLAVLKSGGAFMPLSIDAPVERNRTILRESGVGIVLTTARVLASSTATVEYAQAAHLIDIKTLEASGRESVAMGCPLPEETAYVIHTSGSTGAPKGAMNTDAALFNLVNALATEVYPADASRLNVALVAPFVFDPSIQQTFGALLQGHSLHIVPEIARVDGGALLTFLNAAKIDIADGTPTHLRLLAHAPVSLGNHLSTRLMLIGGEALAPDVVKTFWARFGGAQRVSIVNLYGTAECAVDATFHKVDPALMETIGFVPIGKALANISISILDDDGKRVPDGLPGEITIGGIAVGSGYLARPNMTKERFGCGPSATRIYRTGDLGRVHESGLLQCLGRVDRQLKIHGIRVEPGEIEFALRSFRRNTSDHDIAYCEHCLLDDRHPGVTVEDGVCSMCRLFKTHRNSVNRYFRTKADFMSLMEAARDERTNCDQDCLLLYSGGKDSSYALLSLLELGYRVATFTFDNGYISQTALDNIEHTTQKYGVPHVTASLEQMKQVFAASLRHESTVCGGCFRALTLLSTQLARQRGINVVITGLSRGQIFETKLKSFFEQGIIDPEEIDRRLNTHRELFNIREDPIARAVGLNETVGRKADSIRYVDFFRYDPVFAGDVRRYLASRDERWLAPKDTGLCSTNCRINDVGIRVHQMEKGYHNYAAPLSWNVRFGVTTRQEAQEELAVDVGKNVDDILSDLGYKPRDRSQGIVQEAVVALRQGPAGKVVLCAYFVSSGRVNLAELREHLNRLLPDYMVPRYLVRVDALPLNASGKVDIAKLPVFATSKASESRSMESQIEARLRQIWREVLGVDALELDDNFFDLGGDSFLATVLVSLIESELGKTTSVVEALHHPTIRDMAALLQPCRAEP